MLHVSFRYSDNGQPSERIHDGSTWNEATHIPRVGEAIYLGSMGKYYWYTVKAVRWFDAKAVIVVIHNRREQP